MSGVFIYDILAIANMKTSHNIPQEDNFWKV